MLRDPDKQVMQKAYARWAPVYDVLCGPVFVYGRRAAARAARAVGGRILEIGVGTGLSFGDYDATTEITGIDLSEPMIARAHAGSERPLSVREGPGGDGRARLAL
jgi:phosphatidylethanolamine/phosphatidyl-N-methylethanolamine N-methyltransferase